MIKIEPGTTVGYGGAPVVTVASAIEFRPQGLSLLAGKNGAGKTTFMRFLCGCQPQKPSGNYKHCYLPEELDFDRELSSDGIFSALIQERGSREWVRASAQLTGLDLEKGFGTLSKGNKQKLRNLLVLALARQNDADLVCLDEAMSGLDYKVRSQFWKLVEETSRERHVLMSLHPDKILAQPDQVIVVQNAEVRRVAGAGVTWEQVEKELAE